MGKNGRDSSWSSPTDFSVSVPLGKKTDKTGNQLLSKIIVSLLDLKNMHLDLENVSLDT